MTAPISQEEWERQRRASIDTVPAMVDETCVDGILLPYQARAVALLERKGTDVLVVEKSRRIGLTWGLAAYAVLRAAREKAAGGMDVMYISYSREMTREFVDACAMWARAFNIAADAADEILFADGDDSGDRSIQAFRIRFASGFELMALSSAPRSLRGKQGVVIIDEAAFIEHLAEVLKAAFAFLMWGGQVVVCSTHDGVSNPFNELVGEAVTKAKPYEHIRIDLDDALRDGLFRRICLIKGDPWTPEAEAEWRRRLVATYGDGADEELFCIPSLSSGAWLPAPLIESRMTADAPVLRLELPPDFLQKPERERVELLAPFMAQLEAALEGLDLDPQYAAGFDFGRVADLSVFDLLAIEARLKRREALSIEMRNVPGAEQVMIVRTVLRHVRSRLVGAAFDATGMGWILAEEMGREFGLREGEDGAGLVWAIKFTEDWYRQHMPPLKTAFEDDEIALAKDAEHLSDLRVIKVVRGVPRVPQTREGEKGKRRHGDYAIALALAHFASRQRWVEYGYTPVGRASERRPGEMHDLPDDRGPGRAWWTPPLGGGLRGGL